MRVLLTGLSGTGKSTLVRELRRRGWAAFDADDDGFTRPRSDGSWSWQLDPVREARVVADTVLGAAGLPVTTVVPCPPSR